MATGLLHLHSILRWVILIFLIISIYQSFSQKPGLQKSSLILLIAAHITLLIGVYQWYYSETVGLKALMERMGDFGLIMKDSFARFWAVEHITGMLIAIVLITIARSRAKRLNYQGAKWLYVIALIIILLTIPWPFRELVGRPLFPGM